MKSFFVHNMTRKVYLILVLILIGSIAVLGQGSLKLSSPDRSIHLEIIHGHSSPQYAVWYKNKPLILPSNLTLSFNGSGIFGPHISYGNPQKKEVIDEYPLIIGKTSQVKEHYWELFLPMKENKAPFRKVSIRFRVFNDGLAFRYEFPKSEGQDSLILKDENTEFNFFGNPKVLTLFRENFTTSHEGIYDHLNLKDIKEDTLMDMPTLFESQNSAFVGITEANLIDYAGMYLIKKKDIITTALSPRPDGSGLLVKALLPHVSPWRVLMISDRVGALVESNILTNLTEPNKVVNPSWIKAGKTTFPWWNGNVTPDTSFAPGNNFETNKYYIDFCAQVGLEYHSVVEYGLHEWYVSDGTGFQPGPHNDASTPVPGLDIQQICDYAKTKGVGIRFWVHWKALYPILDKAFTQYEKWGIKGLMCDFMDRDDQEMVNIQNEIVQKAALHHLHIQFHGAYKPTGLQRTYPNEFTREGTLNYENNKGGDRVGPDEDINIPFTRMLAGPTDYHLGGFRAVPRSRFKTQYTAPLMLGTRCHMLAMYVVLENPQGMVCDYPAAYLGQPGFDFIQKVPTIWDETKVPVAEVGQYIALARKKGKDWFFGAISNSKPRTIVVPLSFLGEGTFTAKIYSDAPDVETEPNHLTISEKVVKSTDSLSLNLGAGGGGAAIQFIKN